MPAGAEESRKSRREPEVCSTLEGRWAQSWRGEEPENRLTDGKSAILVGATPNSYIYMCTHVCENMTFVFVWLIFLCINCSSEMYVYLFALRCDAHELAFTLIACTHSRLHACFRARTYTHVCPCIHMSHRCSQAYKYQYMQTKTRALYS